MVELRLVAPRSFNRERLAALLGICGNLRLSTITDPLN